MKIKRHVSLSLGAVLLMGVSTMPWASSCKGLEESACGARTDCRWIDGYTRKDGVSVSGYCRVGKASQTTPHTQPAQTRTSSQPTSAPRAPSQPAEVKSPPQPMSQVPSQSSVTTQTIPNTAPKPASMPSAPKATPASSSERP